MTVKRPQIVNGEIYHLVIRGVDGLKLFKEKFDYLRMIHNLFEFNDENPAPSKYRVQTSRNPNVTIYELVTLKKRVILVEILAFCLMPNHVHLLVRQFREKGISKFMKKIGIGYALYYNKKYKRKGHVFQGRFQIVHIENQEQLKTVFVYIHANPVSLIIPGWKEKGIKPQDLERVIKFLENYRWSSYSDYLEKKNFPSLTSQEFLSAIMSGSEGCREFVNGWLQFKKELADLERISLEKQDVTS